MSMIGNLTRIPEEVRVALHKNPGAINALLYPEFEEQPAAKPGLVARLFGKKAETTSPQREPLPALAEDDTDDVDKAWHALHFLFTGSDWEGDFPQGFLVSCGEQVGEVDVGYGPAKSFTPVQVKEIAAFLSGIDHDELRGRFDLEKMHELEIYPSIWKSDESPDELWEYVHDYLEITAQFVGETAERDMALLVYIN